jgi:uncharacterized glyoxalase superfamily protein PhnB
VIHRASCRTSRSATQAQVTTSTSTSSASEKEFDLGWIASFRSPENRSIQVSLVSRDASAPEDSAISVNVDDVDAAYIKARRRGYEIVHALTEDPWGARRFFVRDTNGVVVNVVGHPD